MAMKTAAVLTPSTAPSRNRSSTSSSRDPSELRSGGESCYFPGCRKDTNCNCKICIASMHATRDLIRSGATSINLSSLTKLSVFRPKRASPVPLPFPDESPPRTPEAAATRPLIVTPPTPPIQSPVRPQAAAKKIPKKHKAWSLVRATVNLFIGFLLLWVADIFFSEAILNHLGPKLIPDEVSRAGEESRVLGNDLKERLKLLQRKIEGLVGAEVSNCSSIDSNWEMNQGGQFLFRWTCVMHKSLAETVSVWGSPLSTSGHFPTGFSRRSMTLLSGKITEWSDGNLLSTLRTSNGSSWVYEKWSSAALHLDANTWMLEYKRNGMFQEPRMIPAVWEALKLEISKAKSLGQILRQRHSGAPQEPQVAHPT